jgi:hypothetical protein
MLIPFRWGVPVPEHEDASGLAEGVVQPITAISTFRLPRRWSTCLESSGILSYNSLFSTGFQCFQQFGGSVFRSPETLKKLSGV